MTVQKGFAFKQQPLPADSSGDGACMPSRFDPQTGCENPGYQQPMDPPRLSTTGGLGNESAHGDVAGWDAAKHNACGEKPGQSAGFALSPNSGFGTAAYGGSETGSDRSGYGMGIAGEAPLSTHGYKDSDTGSDTSGYGKGIGNTDPLRRSNSI
jgi:hypothetical protein